jgi:prepilin-type N-terminal cleavage/methylation domain-containing protein
MQRGFSLIEVMIVSAVLAMLAVSAVPRIFATIATQELQTFTANLAADIRYMQQMSLNANGQNAPLYTLRFARGSENSYYIIHDGYQAIKMVYLPKHVKVTGDPDYIMFSNKGAPRKGQRIEFYTSNAQLFSYVYITGATGRVRVSANGNLAEKDY